MIIRNINLKMMIFKHDNNEGRDHDNKHGARPPGGNTHNE
jgi:hypothetical protein